MRDSATNPPPSPPEKPLPSDCCDSGCARCVFEIYADQLAHYNQQLERWREARDDPDDALKNC